MIMKALQIHTFGGVNNLEIVDIQKPNPGKGQVLVKVYASCVNPFDIKFSEGIIPTIKLPVTLGSDFAGVVCEVGEEATGFAVGNKVYGSANTLSKATGAFAQFAAVPVSIIARMPSNINFNQAASVVLTGVSALQAINEQFQLKGGQKILIHGGAGGIGTIAIQIAKHIGAYIATTVTGDDIPYVKKLGADQVIDYQSQKFEKVLSDYDAVFDTIGGEVFEKSFKVLKPGGIIVSMVAKDDKNLAKEYGVTAISQFTKITTKYLDLITELIEKNIVKPHIDKIFTIDTIREAFIFKEHENVKGKIIIEIQ